MSEPWMEADAREKAWDDYCNGLPECSCCGHHILPGERMLRYEELILCEDCLADNEAIYEMEED